MDYQDAQAGTCNPGNGLVEMGAQPNSTRSDDQPTDTGRYRWRRSRGLLVINDHVALYRAARTPRGPYLTRLTSDYLPGWRRAA